MLFNVLLFSLSLLGSANALPSPSPVNSLAILAARGIDPNGPIPADAVAIPGGGFSFEADSDSSHWVRAQSSPTLSKRENSGLSITMWGNQGCSGSGAFFGNVQYGLRNVGSQSFYSAIEYRGRALLAQEHLELSSINFLNGDKCASFAGTLPGNSGSGCHNQSYSCFILLK